MSAARADYIRWYNSARAHSRLGDLTSDEHYFANLPAQALAAYDEIAGAPRVAHRVGRFVASADRRLGQLCTFCNPPEVHL